MLEIMIRLCINYPLPFSVFPHLHTLQFLGGILYIALFNFTKFLNLVNKFVVLICNDILSVFMKLSKKKCPKQILLKKLISLLVGVLFFVNYEVSVILGFFFYLNKLIHRQKKKNSKSPFSVY